MDGVYSDCLRRMNVPQVIVYKNSLFRLNLISLQQGIVKGSEGLPVLFRAGYNYSIKPLQELKLLQCNRESLRRPVGKGINMVAVALFQSLQYFYSSFYGTTQHFLPSLMIRFDV